MTPTTSNPAGSDYDAVIIGAGVAGIYQLHRLLQLGLRTAIVEAAADLGGTWYHNRYPGCRFDSESYSYGYSFSREVLDEWTWKERFSPQPENLRYLNYVADKFELRQHMRFDSRVRSAVFDETSSRWTVHLDGGETITARFLLTAVGLLSVPTAPTIAHLDRFRGRAFHTHAWPHEPIDLRDLRVGVIGTGATGVQVISAIAAEVRQLTVFQRRPNWCAPLNNSPISDEEMAEIRRSYDAIFEQCARTPGGFIHEPDRRGFYSISREERLALWDRLYDEPGFGIWLQNFREIFTDEDANAEFSAYIAERIRRRVHDPVLADRLIPKDHGFGVQRVPLETGYYEVYNLPHVSLIDLLETPIVEATEHGLRTTTDDYELDLIVFATGFDGITGAFSRMDIRGVGGARLGDLWQDGPSTFLGLLVAGFPNLLTIAGPQSGSSANNFPRGIEVAVNWATELISHVIEHGHERFEATAAAQDRWGEHLVEMSKMVLAQRARSWITGYNSNIAGRENGVRRPLVYSGGAPKYQRLIDEVAESGYDGIVFDRVPTASGLGD